MIRKDEIVNTMEDDIDDAHAEFIQHVTQLPLPTIAAQITNFNTMYGMPTNSVPTTTPGFDPLERMKSFKKILQKEVNEIDDIIGALEANHAASTSLALTGPQYEPLDWMTMLSDLLGDIIVYARSEAEKYGIPMDKVLNIIMESNFSKMGADGNPIYDGDGKLEKGPDYWKPEPRIKAMLAAHTRLRETFSSIDKPEEKMPMVLDSIKSGELELATYGAIKSDDETRGRMVKDLERVVMLTTLVSGLGRARASHVEPANSTPKE